MSRVLVSGASGFTGSYVTSRLIAAGHEVHGLIHAAEHTPPSGAGWMAHIVDLGDRQAVHRIVEALAPERVIHLAAIAFVAHGDVDGMYRTNILGTRNLLEALANRDGQPGSVLLASSANIYGNRTEGVLDEAAPAAPANDYGVSKLAMEYVARLYEGRLPITVVRPFNYTGRGQSLDFLVPKIVDHVRRRAPFIELGNLDVARDFSDVRGVADIYMRLLDVPGPNGTLNICSGRARSLTEILEMLEEISGHRMEVRVNPAYVRANEVKSLCGSRARLEAVVGSVSMPPFEETLRWMLEA
ncbi:GDP-mannose 4,6 dehydratase [Sphingomonas fennica]|uniref:GDP-mannose 4,6 dehydratase n=1 Tax=Edaphosphingomonas fennica TaxID=114404 RepID=A0A2T4HLS4_9SPHN|nr:GDP-mannose 4,6 dehydratase [Sphingomonas fennica]